MDTEKKGISKNKRTFSTKKTKEDKNSDEAETKKAIKFNKTNGVSIGTEIVLDDSSKNIYKYFSKNQFLIKL